MSNQVYSNPQHKYYAQPGSTAWALESTQSFPPAPPVVVTSVDFAAPEYDQGNAAYLTYNGGTGLFTATQEGVYDLNLVAFFQNSDSSKAFELEMGIQLVSGNGDADGHVVAIWQGAMTLASASAPIDIRLQAGATVFLPQGATFQVFVTNYITSVGVNLELTETSTRFYVTKLV